MFSTYDRNQNRHAWDLFILSQLFFRKIDAPSNCFKHSLTEESPLTTIGSLVFENFKRWDISSIYISRSDFTILLNVVKPSEAHGVARLLGFQQSSERKTWLPCQHVTHPQWFALIGGTPLSPLPLRRVQNLKPRECYLWMSPSGHLLIQDFLLPYVSEYNAHISFAQGIRNSAPCVQFHFVGYDAVPSGMSAPRFRRTYYLLFRVEYFHPEDISNMCLRNVGGHISGYVVP
jgi:hypothetical protein